MKKIVKNKSLLVLLLVSIICLLLIAIVIELINSISAGVISSITSLFSEEKQKEEAIVLQSLEFFDISGSLNEDGNYELLFSFSDYNVTDIVFSSTSEEKQYAIVSLPALTGSREEIAYKYLLRQGFTPEGAAGLIANIYVESAGTFSATIEQGSYGDTIIEYRGESVLLEGFGMCQWTNTDGNTQGRRYKLIKYMESKGFDPTDNSTEAFLAQLQYAISEPGYEDIVSKIKVSTDEKRAAEIWCREWEVPADIETACATRKALAEDYLEALISTSYDADITEQALMSLTFKEEDGMVLFDGTFNGQDIGGSFEINDGIVSGEGEYGEGASSSGSKIGNPFGTERFYVSYVALVYRDCPIHGPNELHGGWDFYVSEEDAPIYSVSAGEVAYAGSYSGYGDHVVIVKTGTMYILYAHMSSMYVEAGDLVKKGQHIGTQGNEGDSDGYHLHLEFRKDDLYGEETANLNNINEMLKKYVINYISISKKFGDIIR